MTVTAEGGSTGPAAGRKGQARRLAGPDAEALLRRFPPRPATGGWANTVLPRQQVFELLLASPFALANPASGKQRKYGLRRLLDWLETYPGDTWQQRWLGSGAQAAADWRHQPAQWLRRTGRVTPQVSNDHTRLSGALLSMICGDVIRPSQLWLYTSPIRDLTTEMARTRDPQTFAELRRLCDLEQSGTVVRNRSLRRIAAIMAAKGGAAGDITVGDCLELAQLLAVLPDHRGKSMQFYQMLHRLGIFPADAPPTVRMFVTQGQLSIEQIIARLGIECALVRQLLIDYLHEHQLSSDHASIRGLAHTLGTLFWRDLEIHEPGISSLHLPPAVAARWKQRIRVKTTTTTTASGQTVTVDSPRSTAPNILLRVRAFYLDLAQWAAEDPARWGQWAVPCPIRDGEIGEHKEASRRKARMDQRTRERLPVLPALLAAVNTERERTAAMLAAAQSVQPGELFTAGGETFRRTVTAKRRVVRVWCEPPGGGPRTDLTLAEHQAFWSWATVEVLRHTGVRIEELTELSHHSFIQYRLPTTGELVPLLQIAPSKTDAERLLVISPELAEVLSAVICRIRDDTGAVPLVVGYDIHERVWNPPMPLLFQRRMRMEDRPIPAATIRELLDAALARTGLTDAAGQPLRCTPHDFRRLFVTDAVMNGMPPHIAQLICGHQDINTTMGYKAVYPEEVINGHRAFIARRRAARPGAEYRTPTDQEWEEFLGHFERRKVALGTCGRAFGTSCVHEHSCLRCSLLRPDPAQRSRLLEIRDNLTSRIAETEREGWLGEVEGLKISLAGARQKLAQLSELEARHAKVHLGMPGFSHVVGRDITPG